MQQLILVVPVHNWLWKLNQVEIIIYMMKIDIKQIIILLLLIFKAWIFIHIHGYTLVKIKQENK